jgi:hypothetical protein
VEEERTRAPLRVWGVWWWWWWTVLASLVAASEQRNEEAKIKKQIGGI